MNSSNSDARASATVMLLREGERGLEVFMVKRHHQIDFASGALVFPGGAIEPSDYEIADCAEYFQLSTQDDRQSRALRIGAVRETFEECGLLLARRRGGRVLRAEDHKKFSDHLAANKNFAQALDFCGLELTLDALTPFAHWVTPAFMKKRFDTYFYLAAAPLDQIARHDGFETVDSFWIQPQAALAQARAGAQVIIFPTRLNLALLGLQNSVSDAEAAARGRKIVTVQPEPTTLNGAPAMKIPLEAGYDGDIFPFDPQPASDPPHKDLTKF